MATRASRKLLLIAAVLALAGPADARLVAVPLALDHEFLRRSLLEQVFTDPGNTAQVWNDGDGCNFLTLSDPQVGSDAERIRVTSKGQARVGTAIGDNCLTLIDWTGVVELLEEPLLDAALPIVRFRVVGSHLYGSDGRKMAAGKLWDLVKRFVHPRLGSVTIDLDAALNELRSFLPLVLPSDDAERIRELLDSLSLADVRATQTGVTADVHFDVPTVSTDTEPILQGPPPPEPTLSVDELQRWDAAWQDWDAFLTFVTKQAANDTQAAELRRELFDVLLDARYEMLAALASTTPGGADPVRRLFLDTWKRLQPVLRRLSLDLPGEAALHYLSFIAAADALQAIDEIGPQSGLDISAGGLRRMARMMAPAEVEDPLAYSLDVDPALRELAGFGAPLPLPEEESPDAGYHGWFWASRAWAASTPPDAAAARLDRWVPARNELDEYLPLVRDLLHRSADQTLVKQRLPEEFHPLYRRLVLATAWQESCWRQFIKRGKSIKPIESPVGSVGLMQVNQRVWRGLYDVGALRSRIAYNGAAGSEILVHYLRDYAIAKGEHGKTGNQDNLARATYAVYNGGPGHLRRYRLPATRKSLRQIDDAFWKKYQEVKAGRELAVASCYGGS